MAINCVIMLPGNARIEDVATVMGIAAGLPVERQFLDARPSVSCPSVTIEGHRTVPSLATIQLDGEMVDGDFQHTVLYHFEFQGNWRGLVPPSTPFWISMGRKLVDFFGGKLKVSEINPNPKHWDYVVKPKPNVINRPEDGMAWQRFQRRLSDVVPINRSELITHNLASPHIPFRGLDQLRELNPNDKVIQILDEMAKIVGGDQ